MAQHACGELNWLTVLPGLMIHTSEASVVNTTNTVIVVTATLSASFNSGRVATRVAGLADKTSLSERPSWNWLPFDVGSTYAHVGPTLSRRLAVAWPLLRSHCWTYDDHLALDSLFPLEKGAS